MIITKQQVEEAITRINKKDTVDEAVQAHIAVVKYKWEIGVQDKELQYSYNFIADNS